MKNVRFLAVSGFVAGILLLSACLTTGTPSEAESLLDATAQAAGVVCETCSQATLAAAQTQEKSYLENQAAATAEIMRANAQATLNSANATLSAAQTQDQNNANVVAAQIAATAEIVRANAQATINSAGSTQSAAFTQDAIRQTQLADLATTGAQSILNQQNSDRLAAGTQTAIADNIATQTQVAAVTSQWYADQARQREEQRQGPISFLWTWCLPMFIVLMGGLILWGLWRWLKIQQSNQRIVEQTDHRLPAQVVEIIPREQDDLEPSIESDVVDDASPLAQPDDQVRRWLNEVKRNLRNSDRKDKNDNEDER